MSRKFVPKNPINYKSELVQRMAWRRSGADHFLNQWWFILLTHICVIMPQWVNTFTGDPLHSRAACTQPCNVNTHSRAHCSRGARLCEQWVHGCVNNGTRLCASARLCRGSPVTFRPVCIYGPVDYTIVSAYNGLSPARRQAITWTNAELLSVNF